MPRSQSTPSRRDSRRGMNCGSRIIERRTTISIVGRRMCWIRSLIGMRSGVGVLPRLSSLLSLSVCLGAGAHSWLCQLYQSRRMEGLLAGSCGCVSTALGFFLPEVCTRHSRIVRVANSPWLMMSGILPVVVKGSIVEKQSRN